MEKGNLPKNRIIKSETEVVVEMPNIVEISLVQANELKHYDLFHWLITIFSPIAVGFWTAYFTTTKEESLLASGLAFTIAVLVFFFFAFKSRKKLFRGSIKKSAYLNSFDGKKDNTEI